MIIQYILWLDIHIIIRHVIQLKLTTRQTLNKLDSEGNIESIKLGTAPHGQKEVAEIL